jgi:hypothetical protein
MNQLAAIVATLPFAGALIVAILPRESADEIRRTSRATASITAIAMLILGVAMLLLDESMLPAARTPDGWMRRLGLASSLDPDGAGIIAAIAVSIIAVRATTAAPRATKRSIVALLAAEGLLVSAFFHDGLGVALIALLGARWAVRAAARESLGTLDGTAAAPSRRTALLDSIGDVLALVAGAGLVAASIEQGIGVLDSDTLAELASSGGAGLPPPGTTAPPNLARLGLLALGAFAIHARLPPFHRIERRRSAAATRGLELVWLAVLSLAAVWAASRVAPLGPAPDTRLGGAIRWAAVLGALYAGFLARGAGTFAESIERTTVSSAALAFAGVLADPRFGATAGVLLAAGNAVGVAIVGIDAERGLRRGDETGDESRARQSWLLPAFLGPGALLTSARLFGVDPLAGVVATVASALGVLALTTATRDRPSRTHGSAKDMPMPRSAETFSAESSPGSPPRASGGS